MNDEEARPLPASEEAMEYQTTMSEMERMQAELQSTYQTLKKLNDRMQDELAMAHSIQQSLLLPSRPSWRDPDIVCYTIPAREVGGDFYIYHAFDTRLRGAEKRVVVAVGDVSGKGMPAALLMAISLSVFQSVIDRTYSTSKMVTDLIDHASFLNDFITNFGRSIASYTRSTRQNCALSYVEIQKPQHVSQPVKLRAINAGCVMPIIRHNNGTVEWVNAFGLPLGVALEMTSGYPEVVCDVQRGDIVVLSSDGVIEACDADGTMFGFDQFEHAVRTGPHESAQAMLEHLLNIIKAFVGTAEPHDDITLVVVQV